MKVRLADQQKMIINSMQRLSLDEFLTDSLSGNLRKDHENEMGLFTFYRQQQEKEEHDQRVFSKTKKEHHRRIKFRNKVSCDKRIATQHQERSSEGGREGENCSFFLKNVGLKSFKHKFTLTKEFSRSEEMKKQDIQPMRDSVQNQKDIAKITNSPHIILEQQHKSESIRLLKTFDEILKEQGPKQPPSVENKLFQISPKKMARLTLKVKTETSNPKEIKIQRFIKEHFQDFSQNNESEIEKSRVQQKIKSLQQSFLEKVRIQSPPKEVKIIYSPLDSFHTENKKYISTLINRFQLPQNVENQAAKMLRQTLKFPNLSFTGQNNRRQSCSPTRFTRQINNERKSFSFRKKEAKFISNILHTSDSKSKNGRFFDRFIKKDTKQDTFKGNVTRSVLGK